MNKDTYAHFKQLKSSVDVFDTAYWHLDRLEDSYSYDQSEMDEARDMLEFRKHQLISRMKFLLTQLEEE